MRMRFRRTAGRSPLGAPCAIALVSFAASALALATPAADVAASSSQQTLRCERPVLGPSQLALDCTLDAIAAPQRVTFKVRFTGSHDDTTASLQVALDDAAVACEAGSKTSTEYEDGDVTLECRFGAPARSGNTMNLRASAKWFHADYVSHEIDASRP